MAPYMRSQVEGKGSAREGGLGAAPNDQLRDAYKVCQASVCDGGLAAEAHVQHTDASQVHKRGVSDRNAAADVQLPQPHKMHKVRVVEARRFTPTLRPQARGQSQGQ